MPKLGQTTRESINALNASDYDTWLRERLAITSLKEYGATGNDGKDDTQAFVDALRDNPYVYVPPGEYVVTGFTINSDTILELAAGAVIKTSGTILLEGQGPQLKGQMRGIRYAPPYSLDSWKANIVWTGATNGIAVQVNATVGTTVTGAYIEGIRVDCQDIAGSRAFVFGTTTAGGVIFSTFRDMGVVRAAVGLDLVGNVQTCDFENYHFFNQNDVVVPYYGIGIRIGWFAGPVITTLKFRGGAIGSAKTSIQIGNPSEPTANGGYNITFDGMICDSAFDAAAGNVVYLNWIRAGTCRFINGQLVGGETEPGSGVPTCFPVVLGAAGNTNYQARYCTISGNDIGGRVLFKGVGWEYCDITNNIMVSMNVAGSHAFWNAGSVAGGQPGRRYMYWRHNWWTGGGSPGGVSHNKEITDTFGFTGGSMSGADVDTYGNRTTPIDLAVSAYHITVNNAAADPVIPKNLPTDFRGYVEIVDGLGGYARFWIVSVPSGVVTKIDDTSGLYSHTVGTPGKFNFYYDAGVGYHLLQNLYGSAGEFWLNIKAFPNGG